MPTPMPSKSYFSIRRQRLTAAKRALEKAMANAAKLGEETIEEAAIAATWAAVALVADLVPAVNGIDKTLKPKTTSEDARKAGRLAQAVAIAKLSDTSDARKKADHITRIEPKLKKQEAILRKLKQSKSDLIDTARKLKTKTARNPVEDALVDIAAQAANLADLGVQAGGYMGAAVSKTKDAALKKLLAAQLKQLAAIDAAIVKLLAKMKTV